ncbi:Type III restriction enzyme [Aureococcus anophagefferens]|nr:Type III restriction enzyme [Aureococcus anophagefferens]
MVVAHRVVSHRWLRGVARTVETLVLSSWYASRGFPQTQRSRPGRWTRAARAPRAARRRRRGAGVGGGARGGRRGAWRAAETVEALEGLRVFWEGDAFAPPARIEALDVSHFCGAHTVGAFAAADRGLLATDEYRWYGLGSGAIDDCAAIAESLEARLAQDRPPPDCVLIDGGRGQLNAARRVIEASGADVRALALAKREETVHFGAGGELNLADHDPTLTLLRRLRDEAHASALLAHRRSRRFGEHASLLDGASTRHKARLRAAFPSGALRAVRRGVGGVPFGVATAVRARLETSGDADNRDVAVSLGNRDSAVEALAADGRRSAASLDAAGDEARARRWWKSRRDLRLATADRGDLDALLDAVVAGDVDAALGPWSAPALPSEIAAPRPAAVAEPIAKSRAPIASTVARSFSMRAPFPPAGDQPAAIDSLVGRLGRGERRVVLKGATGTGKTFVLAHAIEQLDKPTLVLAPNKVLAAQLYSELREFFPDAAVKFFVSHFDYYRPESYKLASDTYSEKRFATNDRIDALRHDATRSLNERRDTIVVATVSCIYGLGMPEEYLSSALLVHPGQSWTGRSELEAAMLALRYGADGADRGGFAWTDDGAALSVGLVTEPATLKISVEAGDDALLVSDVSIVTDDARSVDEYVLYPASHYVATAEEVERVARAVLEELDDDLAAFRAAGRFREARRLEQRVLADVDDMRRRGFCPGMENYARHVSRRAAGEAPATLVDFFPDDDWLLVVDEAHVAVPQLRGMHAGDRARKTSLVENGFRLKSALDNRPLTDAEFWAKVPQCVFATATPNADVFDMCGDDAVTSLIVRPTGVVDPVVSVVDAAAAGGLEDHLTARRRGRGRGRPRARDDADESVGRGHRGPAHGERRRRDAGELQALVGCNLLREGLDLPMVSLVAVVGAEKQGFLRSATSLIQTIGRAARHVDGRVLLYTDDGTVSDAMREAIDETNYRRAVQLDHNARHDVVPVGAGRNKSAENTEILDLLGPSKPEGGTYAPDFADPVDAALYDALRDWRKLTAASLGKRPFMVLNQKTWENVVQLRPANESALLAVRHRAQVRATATRCWPS